MLNTDVLSLHSGLRIAGVSLAAFAGGAFGSAIGALPAFIFTGFMVIAGEIAGILRSGIVEALPVKAGFSNTLAITSIIGFGPVFGPHISFAGGASASAFAAKRGYMDTDFIYHEAKNITFAQGPKPDVMFIGRLLGILGSGIATLSSVWKLSWDPIAMGVVLSAIAHRIAFRYPIIRERKNGIINMNPFEGDNRHTIAESATGVGHRERLVVEPWLSHQYKWKHVTMIGFITGILAGYITYKTGSAFLPFGISAATLLFLNCGVSNIPVTHHISLVVSTAVMAATGGAYDQVPLYILLLLGGICGIFSALSGELIQRTFYAHADTHLDPPAGAIVIGTFLIAIFAMTGLFSSSAWVPHP